MNEFQSIHSVVAASGVVNEDTNCQKNDYLANPCAKV